MRICSILECNYKHHAKGYCRTHYGKVFGEQKYIKRRVYKKSKIRDTIMNILGNKCNCCGESIKLFLSIDHVNNDGNKHRKNEDGSRKSADAVYKDILINIESKKYQILCMNCNWGKRMNEGICPHLTTS